MHPVIKLAEDFQYRKDISVCQEKMFVILETDISMHCMVLMPQKIPVLSYYVIF